MVHFVHVAINNLAFLGFLGFLLIVLPIMGIMYIHEKEAGNRP